MKKIELGTGYCYNKETGKLEHYECLKAEAILTRSTDGKWDCGFLVTASLSGVETEILNPDVYANETKFKNHTESGLEISLHNIVNTLCKSKGKIPCNNLDAGIWIFHKGKAVNLKLESVKLVWDKYLGWHFKDLADVYATEEDVYKWNDIIVKEADGTERTSYSLAHYFELTPEQKAILEEYKSIKKRMRDANIGIFSMGDDLYAVNESHLDGYIYNDVVDGYDGDNDLYIEDFITHIGYTPAIYWEGEFFVHKADIKE